MSRKVRIKYSTLVFISIALLIWLLKFNEVSATLSAEDKMVISSFMKEIIPCNFSMDNFSSEVNCISTVQHAVLSIPVKNIGIPKGKNREFKDLLFWKQGECYDISRSIEQCLRYYGFKVRHLMLLQIDTSNKHLHLFPRVRATHQTTEVLTKKGWLVVDNMGSWLSLNKNKMPVSMEDIKNASEIKIGWLETIPHPIYESDIIYVYGLYSRHGKFYPPFFPFPDINYSEFVQNIKWPISKSK